MGVVAEIDAASRKLRLNNVEDPALDNSAANKKYVDEKFSQIPDVDTTNLVQKSGDAMTGALVFKGDASWSDRRGIPFKPFDNSGMTGLKIGSEDPSTSTSSIYLNGTSLVLGFDSDTGDKTTTTIQTNTGGFSLNTHCLNGGLSYGGVLMINASGVALYPYSSSSTGLNLYEGGFSLGATNDSPGISANYSLSETKIKSSTILFGNIDAGSSVNRVVFSNDVMKNSSDLNSNEFCFRNIQISTSEPTSSDGKNGDIWIVYEE